MQSGRKIIHVDMDCFFAAVEMRENPKLKHLPLAVGGSSDRRGVISTCNYIARKYGIHSAMATARAFKLCPDLVLVSGNMALYKSISNQIKDIFLRYSEIIEPLSLDEAFIDVSNSPFYQGSATLIAQAIRRDIVNETGLTASAGVAPNKFLAKIASEENKPDGLFVITPQEVSRFIDKLDLKKIPGVGKATLEKLHKFGLYTAKDVRAYDKVILEQHFGKFAANLVERCFGIDDRAVKTERIRKSIGVEHTFASDLTLLTQAESYLPKLYQELNFRLNKAKKLGQVNKLGIKLKFDDFQQTTLESRLYKAERGFKLESFKTLLNQAWQRRQGRNIRLIGLNVGLNYNQLHLCTLPIQYEFNFS
ncbi:DNA polymerase IV [Catenovulum sp. 2E275]|uniref:DNA polymerase IV n=1 Tax=Catenovulum sp. 2E275 TaxID=2980497 RepID=UPI0021CF0E4B|nr:DNA polymerase IV [Catenovulum sp. 2E275]MCU4674505.1 DNA polymerase IV [Catenovulum sp. 2E275]